MTFKIAYCAGHGGFKSLNPKVYTTAGKRTPDGEPEWNFNNKNAIAFAKEMSKFENVELRRMDDPTGKTDVSLKSRVSKANAWGADIYISFHHNANTGRWGNWTGVETFHWGVGDSLKLAKLIHPKVVKAYGLRDRGLKNGSHLYIIKYTNMPAVLIEGGFMDSSIDIKKLRDENVLAKSGIGVAHAVADYANLKLKPVAKPKPKPITKPEEEVEDMLKIAVVYNSLADIAIAEVLCQRLNAVMVKRSVAEKVQVAEQLYVVGGTTKGLKGKKFTLLSGKDRFATVRAVEEFINKM